MLKFKGDLNFKLTSIHEHSHFVRMYSYYSEIKIRQNLCLCLSVDTYIESSHLSEPEMLNIVRGDIKHCSETFKRKGELRNLSSFLSQGNRFKLTVKKKMLYNAKVGTLLPFLVSHHFLLSRICSTNFCCRCLHFHLEGDTIERKL
jgi:hypothetical protein